MPPRKRQKTSTEEEVLEIVPDGDLILKAGRMNPALMKVSKATITSISKVFKTMLGPNFAEGQKDHTVADPLLLPDDDPTAMKLLMKMAHHTLESATEIHVAYMVGLIMLCEKYICILPFRGWFQAVLARWHLSLFGKKRVYATAKKSRGLCLLDALCVAYLTDDRQSFGDISHEVFVWVSTNEIEQGHSYTPQLLSIMPQDFQSRLVKAQQAAVVKAMGECERVLRGSRFARGSPDSEQDPISCDYCLRQVTEILSNLLDYGCLPPTCRLSKPLVEQMPFAKLNDGSKDAYCCQGRSCKRLFCLCQQKLSVNTKETARVALDEAGKLCFPCFKAGQSEAYGSFECNSCEAIL